jgi:hypothetical protein
MIQQIQKKDIIYLVVVMLEIGIKMPQKKDKKNIKKNVEKSLISYGKMKNIKENRERA